MKKDNNNTRPQLSDSETQDIKKAAEGYQSDPAKTSFELSRAEYFAFCEGADWCRTHAVQTKEVSDEEIEKGATK